MKTMPRPSLDLLSKDQIKKLLQILTCITDNKFNKEKLDPYNDYLVSLMKSACSSEGDLANMINEVERWVLWFRLPGYWLSYILQQATRDMVQEMVQKPKYHINASLLYSDAQASFEMDLAFSSIEVALDAYMKTRLKEDAGAQGFGSTAISEKAAEYLSFYKRHCSTFDYMAANPIADNLYFHRTWAGLCAQFPYLDEDNWNTNASQLEMIIDSSNNPDLIYYRIVARRFLAMLFFSQNQQRSALLQLEQGMKEAQDSDLEAEIGHLYQLHGSYLNSTGDLEGAITQMENARLYEQKDYPHTLYWMVLSVCELGDLWIKRANTRGQDANHIDCLNKAQDCYRRGLNNLDTFLAADSFAGMTRAARRQLFRSYMENALEVAMALPESKEDLLGISEMASPGQATEMIAEIGAARDIWRDQPDKYQQFLMDRGLFHDRLNSFTEDIEDYIKSIPQEHDIRHKYLGDRIDLTSSIVERMLSFKNAEEILDLNLAGTLFLIPFIGQSKTHMFLIDMESHEFPIKNLLSFGYRDLKTISDDYHRSQDQASSLIARAAGKEDPEGLLLQATAIQKTALSQLLQSYERLLGEFFEQAVQIINGRHLVIFPRLQMHQVPFHALQVNGKLLIEHCPVSYCQSLGIFLSLYHSGQLDSPASLLAFYNEDDKKVKRFFEGALKGVAGKYKTIDKIGRPTVDQLMTLSAKSGCKDVLVACHGNFDPDHPLRSTLMLSKKEIVAFSELVSKLDLRDCHSAILAACETGMARTEITDEYIGMPVLFHAVGARIVVSSLWKVNQLATAMLLERYLQTSASGKVDLARAMKEAQLYLKDLSPEKILQWLENNTEMNTQVAQNDLKALGPKPFDHPLFWAGFYLSGVIY